MITYTIYNCIFLANKSLAAISILPLLLPDARSSADDEKIVYFTKVAYFVFIYSYTYSTFYYYN